MTKPEGLSVSSAVVEFVSQATEFYTTVWDDSEAFDPRTPAFARL